MRRPISQLSSTAISCIVTAFVVLRNLNVRYAGRQLLALWWDGRQSGMHRHIFPTLVSYLVHRHNIIVVHICISAWYIRHNIILVHMCVSAWYICIVIEEREVPAPRRWSRDMHQHRLQMSSSSGWCTGPALCCTCIIYWYVFNIIEARGENAGAPQRHMHRHIVQWSFTTS